MKSPFLLLATLNLSLGGLVFLLGLLIFRENPRQRLNRVVASMLFFGGIGSLLTAVGFIASPSGGTAGGAMSLQSIQNLSYLWEFFFPTLFLFACIFPAERDFTKHGRGLQKWVPIAPGFGALVYMPHIVHLVLTLSITLLHPSFALPRSGALRVLAPVMSLSGLFVGLFLAIHQALFSMVNLGFGVAAVLLLADSYRRASAPRLRGQLGVIGAGLALCLALYSSASLIPTLLGFTIPDWLRSALTAAALTVGSGGISYSIVRYKFLDVKLLARRAILYGVASAALVGVYLVLVVQIGHLVTTVSPLAGRVVEPVILIVALILFQPTMSRLEELLDRLFLRDPNDHRTVLRNLGRDLLSTIELDLLLTHSIRTISDVLLLRFACIVALPRDTVLVQSGAGNPPGFDDCERLRVILTGLPHGEESFRVSEPGILFAADDRALLERIGAELVVPLRSRGETVGALLLGDKLTGTEYTSEDVTLLTTLAGTMGVSLQNALLVRDRVEVARFEEELRLARKIQQSFLLDTFPRMPRFEVHALNIPSKEVGGDFYDMVTTGSDVFVMAIADVAGKGVPAALLSSMLQASLRTQAASTGSCADILRNINSLVYRGTAVHQFATFFLTRVESDPLRMCFSNAGHNYPVITRRNGEQVTLERGGIVLGIMESPEYEEGEVALATGDRVVFYTDGITEATSRDGEQYGEERLYEMLRGLPDDLSAREVTDRILGGLREFLGGEEPRDDMTLMVLRVLEREPAGIDDDGVRRDEPEHISV